MTSDAAINPSGVPTQTLIALMSAVFTVSIGFGVLLPLLPYLLERLLNPTVGSVSVAWNTGLLTSIYTLALFLFAPLWGRMSDRHGRRGILLLGMIGFAASMLGFSIVESLPVLYAERFVSGMFAAAVVPIASATIADLAASDESRARRLTMVSLAGISGFLVGPMIGVFMARAASSIFTSTSPSGSVAGPLDATAVLALLVAVAIKLTIPAKPSRPGLARSLDAIFADGRLVQKLLVLVFIVSSGVGVFEVGLALRGKQELGLTQYQIAAMFTECSLVMIVAQAIVFSPLVRPASTRWLITPALAVLAVGLFLVPRASSFSMMLVVIGAVSASAGILSPILTYWISRRSGDAQGARLGQQTAAASLGSAVGAALGGLLYTVTAVPGAPFAVMGVLAIGGIGLALRLPAVLGQPLRAFSFRT